MRILSNVFLLLSLSFCIKAQTDFKVYTQNIPNSKVEFRLVPIPAGEFLMGSTSDSTPRDADEGSPTLVKIDAFWMGAYEVTHDEYELFQLEERDPDPKPDAISRPSPPYIDFTLGMGKAGGFPANSMQPYAVLMYCKWLWKKTGYFFRPPTEAEWEYACRAGSKSKYFFGDDSTKLVDYAWYAPNSGGRYQKVGQKQANPWGLYDMLGNVAEFTLDQYDEQYFEKLKEKNTNPWTEPKTFRSARTVKGGSFRDASANLRSADRLKADPIWNRRDPQIPKSRWWNADSPFVGFRVVRPLKQPSNEEVEAFFAKLLE
jgi:formylglycine-generating enzyme required for sulfatase activity